MGRLALVCAECNRREFANPDWRCPEHPTKTVVQANRPYNGVALTTPKVGKLATVDAGKRSRRAAS